MARAKIVFSLLVVLVGALAASAASSNCRSLDKYFSPTGSFTIFKAMIERTEALTGEKIFGTGSSDPGTLTMFVPTDEVIAEMLQDLGLSIHEFLTMDQAELAKITQTHATKGTKGLTKGSKYLSFNPKAQLTVLSNDGDEATIYTGLTTAMVNVTMPVYDICNTTFYLVDQPLLPPSEYVMSIAGR